MGAYTDISQQFKQNNQEDEDQQLVRLGQQGRSPLRPNQQPQQPQQPLLSLSPAPQPNQKMPPGEQWNQLIGGLNKGYTELDAAGQAQVNDLNHKSESLLGSKDRLRPDEFQKAVRSLQQAAVDYPWDQHVKPKGSNPGDTIEDEGIIKYRNGEGVLEPIGYTAEYIQKNIVPIGDTGQIAVPVSPTEGFKIVSARERDMAFESGEIDKAEKGIQKIYDGLLDNFKGEKQVLDDKGKVIGELPLTSSERRALSIQASDAYIKQQTQAKHAAKIIADSGTDPMVRGMGGDVKDPFKSEQEIINTQQEMVATRLARQDAAKELMSEQGIAPPTPTGSPSPAPGTSPEPTLDDILGDSSSGRMTAEERLAREDEYSKLRNAKEAVVKGSGGITEKMTEGAIMSRPLEAVSKADMNERYADSPEGTVVSLADGRRYIKDEGKYWQIPWSKQQIQSDTMLDAEGEEIIDPNTGEAAPGIMKQLGLGKSKMITPSTVATEDDILNSPAATPAQMKNQIPVELLNEGRQVRIGGQRQQPAAAPGGSAQAVDPERTAAASHGMRRNQLPQPDASQPAVATQEAEQAVMRQRANVDGAYAASLRRLRSKGYAHQKVLARAKPLPTNTSPESIEVGQAFVTDAGEIYIKLEDGRYDGPYTEAMLKEETLFDTMSTHI